MFGFFSVSKCKDVSRRYSSADFVVLLVQFDETFFEIKKLPWRCGIWQRESEGSETAALDAERIIWTVLAKNYQGYLYTYKTALL